MKISCIDPGRAVMVSAALGILLLGGCATAPAPAAGTPPSTAPSAVALAVAAVQVFYPDLKADAALWVQSHPADAPLLAKVENALDPEIAALSKASAPATVSAVILDIQNEVSALPTTVLSAAHQQELDIVLGFSSALAAFGSNAAPGPISASAAVTFGAAHHFVRT